MNRPYSPSPPPGIFERYSWLFPYLTLLAVTWTLYGPSLSFDFVWDDVVYVTQNYRIQGLTWPRISAIWTQTYLGHYAPIHHTFLALVYKFSGLKPFGFHLAQLLAHSACVCLLYLVLKKMEAPRVAFLAVAVFAVHPANVETVAWISESKSTLALALFLASLWFFIRHRETESLADFSLCLGFFALSVLSKINTVVAPAVFLAFDYRNGFPARGRKLWSLACLFLASGAFVLVHLASFHGSESSLEEAYMGGLGTHILNIPFLVLFYLRLAVYPHQLSGWEMYGVQTGISWVVASAWIGAALTILLALWMDRRTQFWLLWFVIFLLPVLQIVPFPIWVADRYLYVPGVGLFVMAAGLCCTVLDELRQRWQQAAFAALLFASLAAFVWRTHEYLPVWRDDLVLWEATEQTCPTSPYCHANLGLALLQRGDVERGVKELIRSVEIRPIPRYLMALGDAYTISIGDYRQARKAFDMASEAGGGAMSAEFYAKFARLLIRAGNLGEAEGAIRKGLQVEPNHPDLLIAGGILEWKRGDFEKSRRSLNSALIVTGRQSSAGEFILKYWGIEEDVQKLMADLKTGPVSNAPTPLR